MLIGRNPGWTCALAFAALLPAASSTAAGLRRHVQLEYDRLAGAERCPIRERLAADVAAYLGYDPFEAPAEERLSVKVEGAPSGGLTAAIELVGPTGAFEGRQAVASQVPDCRQLADSLSLAISLAIDPFASARPAPAPSKVATPPPAAPRVPTVFAIGVAPLGSLGLAPAPALGALIDLEARRGRYSLGVEGQGSLNAGMGFEGGSVAVQLLAGSLVPCARLSAFGGCLLVTAGAELGSAQNLLGARNHTTPYLGIGARAFIEVPLASRLLLRPALEIDVPLVLTSLQVGTADVWTISPVAGALSVTVLLELP